MPLHTAWFGFGIITENSATTVQMFHQTVMIDSLGNIGAEIYLDLALEPEQVVAMPFNHFSG